MSGFENIPRLVIAGSGSGVGKTTMAAALCRALRKRGIRIATFKVGPDYLDPTYHSRAAGSACHNLDGWMMGRAEVLDLFQKGTVGTDLAVLEGVMGLFDGASIDSEDGSTAQIAKWLKAPVLAVIDASGRARTISAIAAGLASFDKDLWLAGILCNRVGSKHHLALLREASVEVPVLGGLPMDEALKLPERYLGLHAASHSTITEITFETLAERMAEWCDFDQILRVAGTVSTAPSALDDVPRHRPENKHLCRIGVAQDAAFHFYYEDNLRRLGDLGAELVYFSPLRDSCLPLVDGLYFGGGYPELFADTLSSNVGLRNEIAAAAFAGKPIYAECAGLMYLSSSIRTLDGSSWPMVGVIGGEVTMHPRLQALGYVEIETTAPSILGPPGLRLRGHQFRYSEFQERGGSLSQVYEVRHRSTGALTREGYRRENVLASYVHVHWASNPAAAAGFVASCARK